VESLGVIRPHFWSGRRVLVTGHTGFKGGWLTLWLQHLGAKVHGLALAPPSDPSFFDSIRWPMPLVDNRVDIRDSNAVRRTLAAAEPSVVFHLAAQPLVRESYVDPEGTFATNVMGTVHLLEAARTCPSVQAVINVTSDKCYDNDESGTEYTESDRLGGADPYSCSKACAELVSTSYRRSFLTSDSSPGLASARAGNVYGGGDWAVDRIVPDCIRAFASGEPVVLRRPEATRPWQHVLDALRGYLLLAEQLTERPTVFSSPFNFGPPSGVSASVGDLVAGLAERWGGNASWQVAGGKHPHEATTLRLDSDKAARTLNWQPLIPLSEGLDLTVDWYRQFASGACDMTETSLSQIRSLEARAGR
jgi:CDP-glucose 4,6-dehydratase